MSKMGLPPFASYPTSRLRSLIVPLEWDDFLDSWSSLAQAYLSLPAEAFAAASHARDNGLIAFLTSYLKETAEEGESSSLASREMRLRCLCFRLTKRLVCETKTPLALGPSSFLGDLCLVYNGSPPAGALVDKLWDEQSLQTLPDMVKDKQNHIRRLESFTSQSPSDDSDGLRRLAAVIKSSRNWTIFLMQGSDLFDALVSAWERTTGYSRTKITRIMFFALTGLLQGGTSSISLLLDHLFSLLENYNHRKQSQEESLMNDLVSKTPILRKLQSNDIFLNSARSQKLLQSLHPLESINGSGPRKQSRSKGKSKQSHHVDIHVHKLSLVSEVQDLFPNCSTSTIVKLLDEFNDNTEKVIENLLENPEHSLDSRDTQNSPSPKIPERRNVFDGDAFDRLDVLSSSLHSGHKETKLEPPTSQNKAAILSALAAFDSDSDERDDTYDIDDVGGTVDNTVEMESGADSSEGILYATWRSSSATFARDVATRRGKARLTLKGETGMSDEAIEGWALMLERNPRQLSKLEAKYAIFGGEQTQLASTAWRPSGAEEEEDSSTHEREGSRGRGGMRGRAMHWGRGGGARGGNVAGPAGERDTQLARQRKDANKSSRANHNRRNQRAKKIARAGFPAAG